MRTTLSLDDDVLLAVKNGPAARTAPRVKSCPTWPAKR